MNEMTDISVLLTELQDVSADHVRAAREQNYFVSSGCMMRITRIISMLLEQAGQGISDEAGKELGAIIAQLFSANEAGDDLLVSDYLEALLIPWAVRRLHEVNAFEGVNEGETSEDTFQYNYEQLKQKDRILLDMLAKFSPSNGGRFTLEETESGYQTLSGRDERGAYYLHGNRNPYQDAKELARVFFHPGCRRYYIFGLGLGYHCKALEELDEGAELWIFETDPEVIRCAMKANRLDWMWANERIRLIFDPKLREFAETLRKAGPMSRTSEEILMIHYPSIRHLQIPSLREYMERLFVDDAGIRNQGPLLDANFRENTRRLNHDIDKVKCDFSGKSAIIVAGGPSLDKNIDLLKNRTDKHLILAVGTVFHKLMEKGIRPDYVIVSDGQKNIGRQFEGLWEQEVPVLILSTAYMGVAFHYHGPKYLLFQDGYKDAEEAAKKEGLPLFLTGGSVSTTALDVCIRLGCRKIATIGLDLAYTGNQSHAGGTALKDSVNTEGWDQAEGYEWIEEEDKWSMRLNPVPVSRTFQMYREWIEQRVAMEDVQDILIVDATEGGALIRGLKPVMLQEYMAE